MASAKFLLAVLLVALPALALAGTKARPGMGGRNATAPLNTCGGNCPSNDCNSCPCGTATAYENIAAMCSLHSDWSQSCCECIVSHESSGNAHAVNHNDNGSNDVGVWQINDVNWPDCSGGQAPCDPNVNADCAHQVWLWGGHTWKLWSTCGGCGCCDRA